MRSAHFIIILVVCLFAGFVGKSQEIKTITLSEALDLGYKNSKQLAISNEAVKEAQARLEQSKDKALPDVGVSGTYLHINTPNIAFSTPPSTDGDPSSPLSSLSNLHDVGLLQLNASLPLFNGLKIRNAKAMNEYLQQAAQYDEQTTHSQVALNTIKAVYQYYELLESRGDIQHSLKQQEQRVKEFKDQEAQGLLARNDRLKAELQANTIEVALTEVNHNVELAQYSLGILLGIPEGTALQLDTTGMFEMVNIKTWDHYLQSGLESRTVLKAGDMQIKASESNYKMAKGNRLPSLSLSAGYVNAYIPNVMNVTNALNGGLSLKYSITGAFHATHLMHEARAKADQAEFAQAQRTDDVKVQIREKYLKCLEAQDKVDINKRTIVQATENFQISENKYKQGLLILSDYLDADVALLRAQLGFARSRANKMVSYYELQESIGTLQ